MSAPTVGGDVDSWCTRCKLILAHTVEAMIGSRITRVHCNTCRAQHAYRPQPPGEGSAPTRPRRTSLSAPDRGAAAREAAHGRYVDLLSGRGAADARPYAATGRFAPSEIILHPTFGLGIVVANKDGRKIEVLFPDGLKVLAHGR